MTTSCVHNRRRLHTIEVFSTSEGEIRCVYCRDMIPVWRMEGRTEELAWVVTQAKKLGAVSRDNPPIRAKLRAWYFFVRREAF